MLEEDGLGRDNCSGMLQEDPAGRMRSAPHTNANLAYDSKTAFVVEGLPDFTAPPNTPDPRALLGCRRMQKVRNTKRPGRQAPGNAPDPPN